jgi:hypothetical protein
MNIIIRKSPKEKIWWLIIILVQMKIDESRNSLHPEIVYCNDIALLVLGWLVLGNVIGSEILGISLQFQTLFYSKQFNMCF